MSLIFNIILYSKCKHKVAIYVIDMLELLTGVDISLQCLALGWQTHCQCPLHNIQICYRVPTTSKKSGTLEIVSLSSNFKMSQEKLRKKISKKIEFDNL